MKRLQKISAVLLAWLLVIGMSLPVYADNWTSDQKIKANGATEVWSKQLTLSTGFQLSTKATTSLNYKNLSQSLRHSIIKKAWEGNHCLKTNK